MSLPQPPDPLHIAREEFLSLIADALKWDEDIDGEYVEGRAVTKVHYHATFREENVRSLCHALGIEIRDEETAGQAIDRVLSEPIPFRSEP